MKEIKFRAWDGTKMHYDRVVLYLGEAWLEKASFESDKILLESTNPCIPMQYTGLKDKNGKEIYEGDVIRRQNENIGKCIFSLGSFWYEGKDGRWGFCMNDAYTGGFEVIGNVYETPDLITPNEQ